MVIDELVAVLGYDVRGEAELSRFNAGLERAAMLANRMASMLVAAGTIAAGALAGLGKSVIETSSKFEGYQTSLETIEGSADKAKAAMDWVAKFAAKTPYELDGVTEAFIKLRAYGFDPMDGTLKTLGDTASAMNKPLMQAVEAMADAATGEFERLKEFGIKAEQKGKQVTFRWQENGKEMTKTVKKNAKEIQKFLLETFGRRFNNAMDRQSRTWKGMMSNLGDSWDDFKRRIGNAGFFEVAKKRLKGILDEIAKLDKNGKLDRWAANLSSALTSGLNLAFMVAERLVRNLISLAELTSTVGEKIAEFLRKISGEKIDLTNWEALAVTFAALLAVLKPAWVAAIGIALAIDDFLTYMRGGDSVIGGMISKLKEMGLSFDSVGSLVSSLAKTIRSKLANIDWTNLGQNLGRSVINGIRGAVSTLKETLSSVDWRAVGSAWLAYVKAEAALVTGFLKGVYQAAMEIDWKSVGNEAKAALEAAFTSVTQAVKDMGSSVGKSVADWFGVENVGDIGPKILDAIGKVDWGSIGKTAGKSLVDGISNAFSTIADVIKPMLSGIDWSDLGKKIGESVNFKAIGDIWVAAMKAQVQLIVGVWNGVIDGIKGLDWSSIWDGIVSVFSARDELIVGIFKGLKDRIVEAIKAWFDIDFTEIGTRIGNGIMAGLQSVGDQIKAWFEGLLPDWAKDFMEAGPTDSEVATSDGTKNNLIDDARRNREQSFRGGTVNNPGKTADDLDVGVKASSRDNLDRRPAVRSVPIVEQRRPSAKIIPIVEQRRPSAKIIPIDAARKDRRASTEQQPGKIKDDLGYGEKIMSALSNLQGNMAKMGGDKGVQQIVNDNSNRSINVNPQVSLNVQQISQAGDKAAAATKTAVDNAAKKVPNPPRTASTPSF